MEACSLYCSGCVTEIINGSGVALSCQCFFCLKCYDQSRRYDKCPSCSTADPDACSLASKAIPDEIKLLIGNPCTLLTEISEIFQFHCAHYKSVIKIAQRQIRQLSAALSERDNDSHRRYVYPFFNKLFNPNAF